MQRLEVSGAVRPIYGSLGVERLMLKQTVQTATSVLKLLRTYLIKTKFKKLSSRNYKDPQFDAVYCENNLKPPTPKIEGKNAGFNLSN